MQNGSMASKCTRIFWTVSPTRYILLDFGFFRLILKPPLPCQFLLYNLAGSFLYVCENFIMFTIKTPSFHHKISLFHDSICFQCTVYMLSYLLKANELCTVTVLELSCCKLIKSYYLCHFRNGFKFSYIQGIFLQL